MVLCSGEVGLRRGVEEDWGRAAASPGGAVGRRTRGIERDDGAEGKCEGEIERRRSAPWRLGLEVRCGWA